MNPKLFRTPAELLVAALLFTAVGLLLFQPARTAEASNAIPLQAPRFQAANPQDAAALAAIGDEAGIAAYFNAGSAVTLATVRDRFRTIEAETADYIIGSVDVADYPEAFDVHVYVHRDGWFMAYYLAADPTSKMVDLLGYAGGTSVGTIFEEVLTIMASEAGVTYPGVTFWHFRYPNANRLMLIVEDVPDGNTFTVKLPSSYVFFERAWGVEGDRWRLNGEEMVSGGANPVRVGTLSAAQMVPNTTYTIGVGYWDSESGVLALVYQAP